MIFVIVIIFVKALKKELGLYQNSGSGSVSVDLASIRPVPRFFSCLIIDVV